MGQAAVKQKTRGAMAVHAGASRRHRRQSYLLSLVMILFALLWILPIVAGVLTSFKANLEVKLFSQYMNLIPKKWTLENYQYVLNYPSIPVFKCLLNSFVSCMSSVIFTLTLCTLSAYGFERFDFKNKEVLFWSLFTLSAIPNVVALVPQYSMYTWIGWINRLPSVIAPTIADVFSIYLTRQFMHGIPKELDESAVVDGASDLQIFIQIILPLIRPVMVLVAIFKFSDMWNDFLWPSIAITTPSHALITPALALLYNNTSVSSSMRLERGLAGCVLGMVPTVVLFLIFRRQFLKGLDVSGGIKG